MSVRHSTRFAATARVFRAAEEGFAIVIALGVMVVTSLLIAAAFVALQAGTHLTQTDLVGKQAYYAAQAGLNAYLYQLNQNPNSWETCANDVQGITPVPGSNTGAQYSYQPVYNSGYSAANCSSDPISALVDGSTGTLRLEFTGYAGAKPQITRTIVASFRKHSPLDYLWYTVYEALDTALGPAYSQCGQFYRTGSRPGRCNIYWVTGDNLNGPAYTQDQYLISGAPVFGRNPNDLIESTAPVSVCSGDNCDGAVFNGTPTPNAPTIAPPSDNSQLYVDAGDYGLVVTGTTTVQLSGTQATVTTCPTATTCSGPTPVSLASKPIIYATNATGCSPNYTPYGATYPTNSAGQYYGPCGDVYVSGNYTTPVTIAAANNVIIDGNLTTTSDGSGNPTGPATLGLVANQFVRVMHGVDSFRGSTEGACNGASNIASQTLINPTIDAAIMALQHSFIVDNYDCGAALGTLTVNGAIAQYFRGTVGTFGDSTTGYLKDYTYDDRLQVTLPPYLFDIATAGWHVSRENLCVYGGSNPITAC